MTGDVQTRIAEAVDDATLLIIGATERGVLSRIVPGSLVLGVLEEVDCSVRLAEKRHERTLRERLFGTSVSAGATAETGVTTEASTPESRAPARGTRATSMCPTTETNSTRADRPRGSSLSTRPLLQIRRMREIVQRTTVTGTGDRLKTRCATFPTKSRSRNDPPWVPMTTAS